jgi:hypothetical protein
MLIIIIIVYREKGKDFILYVAKKRISLSHALLKSVDIPSNILGIMVDSPGIDRGSVNCSSMFLIFSKRNMLFLFS